MKARPGLPVWIGRIRVLASVAASAVLSIAALGAANASGDFTPSQVNCQVSGGEENVNLDCPDQSLPNGEPGIAVDPADPKHVVVSAMDVIECCALFATTFDGGASWTVGQVSQTEAPPGFLRSHADSSVAFDPKHGTVVHLGISLLVEEGGDEASGDADIVAATSHDGGITWGEPTVIAEGRGFAKKQVFNDKPWLTADTNPSSPFHGRLYATWDLLDESGTDFAKRQAYGPTMESHSDDGGLTWSQPQDITGINKRHCTFTGLGAKKGHCEDNFFTTGAVDRDGVVTIAFLNPQNRRAWERRDKLEDQYMVVRSKDGGETWSRPRHVVNLEDGVRDYPIDPKDDAQTLTGYQLVVTGAGNITIDPATGRYYLVFSDNRAGRHDVRNPVTNTGIYMMTSRDGKHWKGPVTVANGRRDQWMPFAAVDPMTHRPSVLFNHRSFARSSLYNARFARQRAGGRFSVTRLSTASSHPKNALWMRDFDNPFSDGKPPCRRCAQWAGDYVGMAYGGDGTAYMAWNELSRFISDPSPLSPFPGAQGYDLDVFFGER